MININLTNPLLETVSLVKHKALTSDKTERINKRSIILRTGLHQGLPEAEVQSTSTAKDKSM